MVAKIEDLTDILILDYCKDWIWDFMKSFDDYVAMAHLGFVFRESTRTVVRFIMVLLYKLLVLFQQTVLLSGRDVNYKNRCHHTWTLCPGI